MNQYEQGYRDGLRAAELVAERVRDAKNQQGKHEEAEAAEQVRLRILERMAG